MLPDKTNFGILYLLIEDFNFSVKTRPDPFYNEADEIKELDELLPEMKDKINDMEQMKIDSKEKLHKLAKVSFQFNFFIFLIFSVSLRVVLNWCKFLSIY